MKCLGQITDFHYADQKGFVILDHLKIPFDKGVCSPSVKILGDGYVKLITYEPSSSLLGWRVVRIENVDEDSDYIKNDFFNFGHEERALAITSCNGVVREIINNLIDSKVIEEINKSVQDYLNAFNIESLTDSVTGRISSTFNRKSRDETWNEVEYSVWMEAGPSKTGDPYTDGSSFHITKDTFHGYGPYETKKEYEKEQTIIDQATLPSFIEHAKKLIHNNYSIDNHYKCLFDHQFKKIRSALWIELSKIGTTRVIKDITLMHKALQRPIDTFFPDYFLHQFLSTEVVNTNTSIQRLEKHFADILKG